ncbi:MAG TPA: TIGR00725 family protein [Clostridia bacterium]
MGTIRKTIAIAGDSNIDNDPVKQKIAFETGKILVDHGFRIISGGLGGVMEYAFKGAHASKNYKEGDTIGILPMFSPLDANQYADVVIPTGLDLYRNVIIANSASALVAIGGGAGTLSEIANAWALHRLIIAYKNVNGWSAKVADTKLDHRIRYKDFDDKIFGVSTPEEMIEIINQYIGKYNSYHKGIIKGE